MMSSPLLSKMREDYKLGNLEESSVEESPFKQFEKWFGDEILWKLVKEPNAMTLSTANKDGKPSGRIVLLKYFDEQGFVFFTNYNSRKSKDLLENPFAALTFYWTQRQVRIEGSVEKLTREDSEKYFQTRPRESQVGAWVSEYQSSEVTKQSLIETQYKLDKQFKNQDIPMPDFWGGWRVIPTSLEFWQGKGGRIHDRIKYKEKPLSIPLFKDLHLHENSHEHSHENNTNTTTTINTSTNSLSKSSTTAFKEDNKWIIKRLSP